MGKKCKCLLFSVLCFIALAVNAQTYVDLGLPSGTKWKSTNESGFYTYDEALSKYGRQLPTESQFKELKNYCEWTWTGRGYKVVGPNGSSIFLPAAGVHICNSDIANVGSRGYYWSSTPSASTNYAEGLESCSSTTFMSHHIRCNGQSLRLVKK